MLERILITGAGGQGVILLGRLLASSAVEHIPHITFFPSYGAEVRGGTSVCQVILSAKEIASPLSETFDSILVMNQISLENVIRQMKKNCLVLVNSSLCKIPPVSSKVVSVDATRLADNLGDTRVANFIMLGAYLAAKPVVTPLQAEKSIRELLAGKNMSLIELNIKAFRTGLES
ncbi:MAG: 2-oxoacid:acceptor oxidoreductase family protein [Kiritimatiellae bacterium]|nr:2-oxoacid:acceptor oxidoreductase family protein [Kiritimatiellia bacterium]MDD5520114.1 2-oxoacid:acceptor oxidoreductase family protein [Kiritimatiellia bacterium]